MENENKKIRVLKGVVVSDKMTKTVVVAVTRLKKHPKYKKYYKVTKKYKAHDEKGEYHIGDKVLIQETKPMSKDKRWIVSSKIAAGKTV
jgi:small subunit ribosomal protein S17